MAIRFDPQIHAVSQKTFHAIDYQVMALAFSVHKSLGRMWDEKIYQNELAFLCQQHFDHVAMEEPVVVEFRDFRKILYIDLLIDKSVLYELKTAASLAAKYRTQTLNYLLLTGLTHGKLLNMRTASVQSEFVSTRVDPSERYRYSVHDEMWQDVDSDGRWFKQLMLSLLAEWGAFLDTTLFYDAIYFFRGGQDHVVRPVEITNAGRVLGQQSTRLLNDSVAFKISAVAQELAVYRSHLQRFLEYSSLEAVQWVNFNHHDITFETVTR
jgi:GxxExxY protein